MTGSGNLALAGLDGGDVASASHPYLQLAAARRARTARLTPGGLPQPPEVMGVDADARVANALQPMSGEFERGHEVGDGRPAYFGRGMPPPTGVSNGQMDGQAEPLFAAPARPQAPFGSPVGMPPSAAAVATGSDRFGGAVDWSELAGLPTGAATAVSALPRFAAGGVLGPGDSGVVGEDGPEVISTLPAGGARVVPLPGDPGMGGGVSPRADLGALLAAAAAPQARAPLGGASTGAPLGGAYGPPPSLTPAGTSPAATELSGLGEISARAPLGGAYGAPASLTPGAQALSPRMQRSLAGYQLASVAPPPGERSAQDAYGQAVGAYEGAAPPQRGDAAYHTPWWQRAAAIGAGAVAGGLARNPAMGAQVAGKWAPDKYAQAQQDWQQQRQQQLAGLGPLEEAAKLEQGANANDTRAWQQQQQAAGKQQQADQQADYRDLQQQDRETAAANRATYEGQLAAARQQVADAQAQREGAPEMMQTAQGDWMAWYPESGRVVPAPQTLRGARRGNQAAPPNEAEQGRRSTAQVEIELSKAPTRQAAEDYLAANAAALEAVGVDGAAIEGYLDKRWPQQKAGTLDLGPVPGGGRVPAPAPGRGGRGGAVIGGVVFPQ